MTANSLWMKGLATLTQLHCSWPTESLAPLLLIGSPYAGPAICWKHKGEHAVNENKTSLKGFTQKIGGHFFILISLGEILPLCKQKNSHFQMFILLYRGFLFWSSTFTFWVWLTPWLESNDELRQILIYSPEKRMFLPFHSGQLSFYV